jgi:hypothetical protein
MSALKTATIVMAMQLVQTLPEPGHALVTQDTMEMVHIVPILMSALYHHTTVPSMPHVLTTLDPSHVLAMRDIQEMEQSV